MFIISNSNDKALTIINRDKHERGSKIRVHERRFTILKLKSSKKKKVG